MGLNLRNVKKGLERKINKCIDLLDDEYKSLNFTIYFYENKEKLLQEKNNKPEMKEEQYEQILNGKCKNSPAGITIGDKGKIKIFLFHYGNLKKEPAEVMHLIALIYHEIRHAWQVTNNSFQDEEEISKIDGNFEKYINLPSEKDAYTFQEEQMKKHGTKILGIFGYNLDFKYELSKDIKDAINA